MEFYIIRAHPYVFHAQVRKSRGQPTRIKFGGKLGCVNFTIHKQEPNPQLEGVRSHADCAVSNETNPDHGMLPSSGTVKMLKAAVRFLYELFPRQRDIYFSDSSYLECSGGKRVYLYDLHIAKYFKTWYQDKISAVTLNPAHTAELDRLVDIIRSPYHETSWAEFSIKYLKGCIHPHALGKLEQTLKPIFESNTTYHGFFKAVAQYDCAILDKWFYGFMVANSRIAFNNIIWVIKKDVAKTFPDILITKTNEPGVPLFNQHSGVGDQSYMFKFGGRLDSMGRFEEYMP
ncbi:MAG: hypothetical protein EB059_10520 [Alphaproteobacteria bacterium]|nr:hypothetical protein [Alphaproteobacteria bacterium]